MEERHAEIVWLTEERTFAELISLSAHFAKVRYTRGGIDHEVLILHDEFKYIEGEDADSDDAED